MSDPDTEAPNSARRRNLLSRSTALPRHPPRRLSWLLQSPAQASPPPPTPPLHTLREANGVASQDIWQDQSPPKETKFLRVSDLSPSGKCPREIQRNLPAHLEASQGGCEGQEEPVMPLRAMTPARAAKAGSCNTCELGKIRRH